MKETRKIGQEIKKLQQQRAEIQASGLKAAKEALAEAKAKAVEAEAGRVRREQRERVIHAPQRESAPVIQCSSAPTHHSLVCFPFTFLGRPSRRRHRCHTGQAAQAEPPDADTPPAELGDRATIDNGVIA
jgi:hypothetical protein